MSDTTFNLADAVTRPVVQLDEHTYHVKQMTRNTMVEIMGLDDAAPDEEEPATPEQIDALAYRLIAQVDVVLDPDGDATPRAASVLRGKWDADGVALEALTALAEFVGKKGSSDPPA